jgi:hypothetical protein
MAKAGIKGGLALFEKGKEVAAEAQEVVEDLVAEVKAEIAVEKKGISPAPTETVSEEGSGLKS